jgi:uncharacterized protein
MSAVTVLLFIDGLETAFREGDPNSASKAPEAENVRRLREQYRAIAAGDFAGFVSSLAEDVEMEIAGPDSVPFRGRWQGRDRVIDVVRSNFAQVEDQEPRVEGLFAQGDTVVILGRERGRYRATGQPYEYQWVQFHTFRDGKVVRFREVVADPCQSPVP